MTEEAPQGRKICVLLKNQTVFLDAQKTKDEPSQYTYYPLQNTGRVIKCFQAKYSGLVYLKFCQNKVIHEV